MFEEGTGESIKDKATQDIKSKETQNNLEYFLNCKIFSEVQIVILGDTD